MAIQEGQNVALVEAGASKAKVTKSKPEGEGQQLSSGQKIATHIALILMSIAFLLPFFWMITGSLKTDVQLGSFPITWLPNPVTFGNYVYGLQAEPFGLYILNSLLICFLSIIGAIFSSSFVAYGLARIDWPLRTPLFVIILGTTMIPFYVTMVPLFTLFRTFGWVNTYLPLVIPSFVGVPFFIFLLRQFFLSIPKDLSEAAKVDGANELTIFFRVILPLSKPALAAIALFQFVFSWSDFLGPLIYLNDASKYTVSIGLTFFQGQYTTEYGALMAAATVMLIPVIILFFFAQRTFIQGITLTGVKG